MILATFDTGAALSAPVPGLVWWRHGAWHPVNSKRRPGTGLCVKDGAEDAHEAEALGRSVARRVRIRAAIHAVGHQARIVLHRRFVADKLRLGADAPQPAAVAEWKQPAEVVDDLIGIKSDGLRVVPDERAGIKTRRPAREIIGLESLPEFPGDVRPRDD